MENDFVENFKSEELEERLEFAKWTGYAESTHCVDENGDGIGVVGATCIIPL